MYSSQIYSELATARQTALIATADAHRAARLAGGHRRTSPRQATAPRNLRAFVRSILPSARLDEGCRTLPTRSS
jgi:hypothetical protein